MAKILVVDDDKDLRFTVLEALRTESAGKQLGFTPNLEESFDGIDALEKVKSGQFDLVLLDVDMPRLSGLDALQLIKQFDPSIQVIVMTAYANIGDAVQVVKEGAFHYLAKPIQPDDLAELVSKALQARTLISNIAASAPVLTESGRKIIGSSREMQKVFNIINRLSKVETPVLIRGASGTGKELVARAIHFNSSRKDGRFVAINCSAIPENLFESELFGHEKGSFTGAHERKIGKFQYAEGGTLFLDEMGEMPVSMQVKLLRVLQERMFTPVGSNRELESNVRVIAATNRNLEQMIQKGEFREDLYYRLNVVPIYLPSLAERKNDLETLIQSFIKKFNQSHGKRITAVSPDAMQVLKRYGWPGNIRELENVIEHGFILESSTQLTLGSLPESVLNAVGITIGESPSELQKIQLESLRAESVHADIEENEPSGTYSTQPAVMMGGVNLSASSEIELDYSKLKEAFEREFIVKALRTFKGRINQTALHANIPKKTLLRKIEKYGIVARDFSDGSISDPTA